MACSLTRSNLDIAKPAKEDLPAGTSLRAAAAEAAAKGRPPSAPAPAPATAPRGKAQLEKRTTRDIVNEIYKDFVNALQSEGRTPAQDKVVSAIRKALLAKRACDAMVKKTSGGGEFGSASGKTLLENRACKAMVQETCSKLNSSEPIAAMPETAAEGAFASTPCETRLEIRACTATVNETCHQACDEEAYGLISASYHYHARALRGVSRLTHR
jgi:hypothetical protein